MEVVSMDDVPPSASSPPPTEPTPRIRSDRSVQRQMEQVDNMGAREWMEGLVGGESPIKVTIRRKKPVVGPNGENIGGVLETVEEMFDDDYIRDMWGGGDFLLQVQTQKADGKFGIVRGRTVKIAGPPKMHGQLLTMHGSGAPVATAAEDSLAERAFATMERNAREAQARADRVEQVASRSGGLDVAALRELNAPLLEQLRAAQDSVTQLQAQVLALTNRPPPKDEFRDKLLERAIGDESARIEALRAQYEARIDRMRDNHDDQIKRMEERFSADVKRLEDRHNDEVRRLESRHERELKLSDRQSETTTKAQDTANQARIDALNSEKDRLRADLTTAQARIATLEAKKDQSISEKADELIKVKEALEGLGGGDADDADKKWYEKILDIAGNSEAALKFIDKLGGGPGQAGGGEGQPQLPPPGVPFQTGDGNVYVRDPQGNVSIVPPAALQQGAMPRKRRRVAGPPQQAPEQAGADEEVVEQVTRTVRPPKPDEVKLAVTFMENAVRNGTEPEKFARGARNLVPGDVLTFIQRVGVDAFLDKVVDAGSPLASVRGRQFARAVAKILVQGEAMPEKLAALAQEEPDEPPSDEPDETGDE